MLTKHPHSSYNLLSYLHNSDFRSIKCLVHFRLAIWHFIYWLIPKHWYMYLYRSIYSL